MNKEIECRNRRHSKQSAMVLFEMKLLPASCEIS